MEKKSSILFSTLFFILLLPSLIHAVGISPAILRYDFQPNLKDEVIFMASGSEKIGIEVKGDLAQYMEVDKEAVSSGETFTLSIQLPEQLEIYGEVATYLIVTEIPSSTSTVTASTAIRVPVYIQVPYPGIYANVRFTADDTNLNENLTFAIDIQNLGTQQIVDAKATIKVFDLDNNLLKTIATESYAILPQQSKAIKEIINSSELGAGSFLAKADITYGAESKILNDTFRIGSLDLKVLNHSKEFYNSTLSEFKMAVESNWNLHLKDIYAEIIIQNHALVKILGFRTINANINPFSTQELTGFFNPQGLPAGEYPILIQLHFNNQVKEFASKITILHRQENGLFAYILSGISNNLLLIIIIILLILGNFYLFFRQKKAKETGKNEKESKETKKPEEKAKKDNFQKEKTQKEGQEKIKLELYDASENPKEDK